MRKSGYPTCWTSASPSPDVNTMLASPGSPSVVDVDDVDDVDDIDDVDGVIVEELVESC